MTDSLVTLTMNERVAELTLNRPAQMNALTPQLLGELLAHLEDFAGRDDVSVIVLTGAGRAFSAGVDLKALRAEGIDAGSGDVGKALNQRACAVIRRMETMPQAVIGKINGFCFTGGLELALGCDIRIAAEEAKFGDTHAILGFRPTWGMTQRLPRLVGSQRARELSFTARTFSGREAAAYGLVLEAVPLAALDETVATLARQIAANSPGSIAAYKALYDTAANQGLTAGLTIEEQTEFDIPDTGDRLAAFLRDRL